MLQVEKLNKVFYHKKQQLYPLKDVSFTIKKSEFVGIVGESGCGKSTLAKVISGILPQTSGDVFLDGMDYNLISNRNKKQIFQKVQMIFQDPLSSFSPRMTIEEYLCEPMRNFDKIKIKEAREKAKILLEQVGLSEDNLKKLPHQLSGGQLQRVAIARAISISIQLLICDEATSALDVTVQKQIVELLLKLKKERALSAMVIGHDLALVRSLTDTIIVMYLGCFVEKISSKNLKTQALHPYTKALLASNFDVYCNQNEVPFLLQGETPSLFEKIDGCVFANRCPQATALCKTTIPSWKYKNETHSVACHYCE